jgi:glycosyltransferase involved in cell wall biosynthesis
VRVLLVSANFRPHVGGVERFTEVLATGLAERGHTVTVLCCRDRGAPLREEIDGFTVIRVPAAGFVDRRLNVPYPLPSPVSLLRALRRELANADVVHVQDAIYATSAPALFLARRRNVASVLTMHVGFVPQANRVLDAVERAALATFGRSARLATIVASYNPSVASWAEQTWGLVDVRVLPVGVTVGGLPAADRDEVRRSFGLPTDRLVALFVGRDVPSKSLDVFLAASDPAYELVAVTDRPAGDTRARLLQFMDHDRLQALFGCVDAFVQPSMTEGVSLALQEALVVGLPVITTWQPGYERYLSDQDVLVVDRDPDAIRQALRRLVSSEELRQTLSARARLAGETHFGAERFVSAYEDLYEEARSRRLP